MKAQIRRATCVLLAAMAALSSAARALDLKRELEFQIPSQTLGAALLQFSKQAGVQVLTAGIEVSKASSPGITGRHTLDSGLLQLLADTGFVYQVAGENTISIVPVRPDGKRAHAGSSVLAQADTDEIPASHEGSRVGQPEADSSTDQQGLRLEEIVVTAQKREENLQDVPVPVTAISAEALVSSNQLRLQDYYSSVPGLQIAPGIFSSQGIAIRGITTGSDADNPTVGITIDDAPYGGSTGWGSGQTLPDIDPGDLERIEVLRGPQGTLYGASSMGGLIKFVTVDPSTDRVSGRLQAGASSLRNGADIGYSLRGSINVPVSDDFAVRASGFTRRDPGFIDNPVWGIEGVNESRVDGGRLAALWRPAADVSLKLSAMAQQDKGEGATSIVIGPGLSDLQQDYLLGSGGYVRKAQAYGATLKAKLGGVDLVSISGYNINTANNSTDFTAALGFITESVFPGVTGTPILYHLQNKKVVQELRLSAPWGERADWLLGGFYTRESAHWIQHLLAQDNATGEVLAETLTPDIATTFQEYAAFADLTYRFTDRLDLQVGGRQSRLRQTFQTTQVGLLVPVFFGSPSPLIEPERRARADAFTYLLTPRFKLSSDLMIYARLASGYRAGGTNARLSLGIPLQYEPDKTQNYELGIKGDFLDRRLSLDASLYYIDWKQIQLGLADPDTFSGYIDNAGKAKSQGVELSLESRPMRGMSISGWVALNEAELTESLPIGSTAFGEAGDRLPFAARVSGNVAMEQSFPLMSDVTGLVGAKLTYVGDRVGPLANPRQEYPSYTKIDLQAGVRYDAWSAHLFVNNLTDKRSTLNGGLGTSFPQTFYIIQPRMVGLSLVRTF